MNNTGIENGNGVLTVESDYSKSIKFWVILVGQVFSVPCYFFVIYQFLSRRILYSCLHNHVVIVSLILNLIIIGLNVTFHLIYIRTGTILPSTPGTCLLWQYLDYGFWFGDLYLKFWAAVERHILIFHSNMMNNRFHRILFHYIPLSFFTLYCPVVYLYLIFFYSTDFPYDYNVLLCAGPAYYVGIPTWLVWYESLVHYVIPIFMILLFAMALPIRVFIQKARLHLNTSWRQYRKMTIQLLSIAAVYVFDLPYVLVTIIRWSGFPDFGVELQGPYFYYCNYIPNLLFPWAIIGSIPNLKNQIRQLLACRTPRRQTTIVPHTATQR